MATSPDTSNYGRGFTTPGLGSAGAYQVSGYPYMTGSGTAHTLAGSAIKEIIFPSVTKSITLMSYDNSGGATLVLAFADPTNPRVMGYGHAVEFPNHQGAGKYTTPVTLDVKCSRVWIQNMGGAASQWSLYASLTSVNPATMYNLSGSGINV